MAKVDLMQYYVMSAVVIILVFVIVSTSLPETKDAVLEIPEGFAIAVYADTSINSLKLPGPNSGPRMIAFDEEGHLVVSLSKQGTIVKLPDYDGDGVADDSIELLHNLARPHGIAFLSGWLYVAEESQVIRAKDINNDDLYETIQVLVDDMPRGGHWTRSLVINQEDMYVSIGSSCNDCEEEDELRASVVKCDIRGENCSLFASGLRNAVGIEINPLTKELWVTENSRDFLGEDLPPDEINVVSEGAHYGWPYCFGNNVPDPEYDDPALCVDTIPSKIDLQAHSAPLGFAFYQGDMFPHSYKNKMFVAYHGSWNRNIPTGYKVVVIDPDSGTVQDFITGFLTENNDVLGRPVDIVFDADGAMFISDDNQGKIYKVTYSG